MRRGSASRRYEAFCIVTRRTRLAVCKLMLRFCVLWLSGALYRSGQAYVVRTGVGGVAVVQLSTHGEG